MCMFLLGYLPCALQYIWHFFARRNGFLAVQSEIHNNILGIFSLFLLLLLFFQSKSYFTQETREQRQLWHAMLVLTFVAQLTDIIGWLAPEIPGRAGYYVAFISDNLLYVADIFLCLTVAMFIEYNTTFSLRRLGLMLRRLLPFIALYLVLLAVNMFAPIFFYVSKDHHFVRGDYHLVAVAGGLFPLFYALVQQLLHHRRRHFSNQFLITLYLCALVPITGITLQMLDLTPVPLVYPCIALSVVLVTLFLMNNSLCTDYLTGTLNNRGLELYFQHLSVPQNSCICVIFIDFDDFKKINDQYGHREGDYALRAFAETLRNSMPCEGALARVGGDEFVLVTTYMPPEKISGFMELLGQAEQGRARAEGKRYLTSFSYGYSVCAEGESPNRESLLALADKNMYEKKLSEKKALH